MSMAIARAKYTGDPGFFDFLKKGAALATSFIPGVGSGISQAIMGIGRQPARPQSGPGGPPLMQPIGAVYEPPRIGPIAFPTPYLGSRRGPDMPGMAMNGNGMAAAGGYHLNKSDYFLKSGEYVPAGTRWVRNRKRNPANARATSRAISRVVGAKKYATSLSRISIRKKC